MVLARITPAVPMPDIELVQGSHVVVDGTLHRGVYYTEAEDKRAVFVMPRRGGLTLIVATETPFSGDPAAVRPLPQEVDYLLRTYRRYFPQRDADVRDQFAGLRATEDPGQRLRPFARNLIYDRQRSQPAARQHGRRQAHRLPRRGGENRRAARTRRGDTRTLPLDT